MRELLAAANRRYLEFLSALDDPRAGIDRLRKVSEPARESDRSYRGLNFFSAEDQALIDPARQAGHHQRIGTQELGPDS